MAGESLKSVVRHIRRLMGGPAGDLTDRQLLDRFLADRAEDAFAALVDRHGPLVLGVSRRVLADSHDADDAFQATFLVLARKAGSIRQRDSLPAWLYGVATRIAVRMRGQLSQRRSHERQAADMRHETTDAAAAWEDLRPALDEELNHLPDKFRVPLVLHYFQGKSTAEAAQELGCPAGSLTWRLMRGRDLLRARLARRGITLPAALLASLLTESAGSAAVPGTLASATVQAALCFAAGQAAEVVSHSAVSQAQGVIQAMFWTKLRNVAAVLAVVCVVGAGLAAATVLAPIGDDPKAKPGEAKPAEKGKTDPEGVPLELRVIANKDTYTLDPDLKKKLEAPAANVRPGLLLLGGPQGSAVDLVLEVKNTSDKEVEVWKAGDPVQISFKLEGPGAVTRNVNRPRAAIYMFPQAVKLAPGKTFTIPVKALDNNIQAHYFTAAGEYTLTATIVTGMLPAPKGAKISDAETIEGDPNQPVAPPVRRPVPLPPGKVVPLPAPAPAPKAVPPAPGGAAPGAVPGVAPKVDAVPANPAAAPQPAPAAEPKAVPAPVPGGNAVPGANPVQVAPVGPGGIAAPPKLVKKGFGIVTLTSAPIKIKVEAPK